MSDHGDMMHTIGRVQGYIDELKRERDGARKQRDEYRTEAASAKLRAGESERLLVNTSSELGVCRKMLANVTADLDAARAEVAELKARYVYDADREITRLRAEVARLDRIESALRALSENPMGVEIAAHVARILAGVK